MRVLMTGATGFIGQHVLQKLITSGDEVRVLALPGTEKDLPHPRAVRVFRGSLDDTEVLSKAVRGVRTVYHLCSLYPQSPLSEMIRVNVDGTRNLLQAALRAGVRRFIYVSSSAVYEPAIDRRRLISENSPLRTSNRGSFGNYALTKIAAEKLIREYNSRHDLEYVILRPTEVYGPPRPYFEKLIKLIAYRPRIALSFSAYYGVMQWIHMNDFVDVVVTAGSISESPNDTFNIGGTEGFTVGDLIPIVWKLMGHETAWVENAASRDLKYLTFDLSKAREVLGFEAKIKLEQGLRALVMSVGETGLRARAG